MKREQILDGLRHHHEGLGCWVAESDKLTNFCPYYNINDCHQQLGHDADDLICSQAALLDSVYLEVKAEWNRLRAGNTDPEILKFLVHLMEMLEGDDAD